MEAQACRGDAAWQGAVRKTWRAAQEAPLLKQLLSSSSPEQAAERLWLARLLAAGFQDQTEGDIFRCAQARCRYTLEMLLSGPKETLEVIIRLQLTAPAGS